MKKLIAVIMIIATLILTTGCTKKIERTVTILDPSASMFEEVTLIENQLTENQLTEHWD